MTLDLNVYYVGIQWFGVDIGGTLVKCVYFEIQETAISSGEAGLEHEGVLALKKFVKSNLKYGSSGTRDEQLQLENQKMAEHTGTLHFIKFATSRMDGFFDMVTKNGLSKFSKVVCATGGGAFKFEKDFQEVCICNYIMENNVYPSSRHPEIGNQFVQI